MSSAVEDGPLGAEIRAVLEQVLSKKMAEVANLVQGHVRGELRAFFEERNHSMEAVKSNPPPVPPLWPSIEPISSSPRPVTAGLLARPASRGGVATSRRAPDNAPHRRATTDMPVQGCAARLEVDLCGRSVQGQPSHTSSMAGIMKSESSANRSEGTLMDPPEPIASPPSKTSCEQTASHRTDTPESEHELCGSYDVRKVMVRPGGRTCTGTVSLGSSKGKDESKLWSASNQAIVPSEAWQETAAEPKERSERPSRRSWDSEIEGDRRLIAMAGYVNPDDYLQKKVVLPPELANANLGRWRYKAAVLVHNQVFDWTICTIILLNALSIGVQTDYVARTQRDETPTAFFVLELMFCAAFLMEIVIRLFVFRHRFFYNSNWSWNWFDFILVLTQLAELLIALLPISSENPNLGFARMLKLLRMARAFRVARMARLIRELRTLVRSMTKSMKSLGWTCLLLLMMIYMLGLLLTQVVSDYRMEHGEDDEEVFENNYRNMVLSMLTLFKAISGGDDWSILSDPLMFKISPVFGMIFVAYIGFAMFAMMNVVTGIFVDATLASARQDKEQFLIANAREIFKDVHGGMNLDEFLAKMDKPEMQEFFRGIDVDPTQAKTLFNLVDLDDSGEIEAEEFFSSCIRLNGPAKALDTQVLVQEVCKISERVMQIERATLHLYQTAHATEASDRPSEHIVLPGRGEMLTLDGEH